MRSDPVSNCLADGTHLGIVRALATPWVSKCPAPAQHLHGPTDPSCPVPCPLSAPVQNVVNQFSQLGRDPRTTYFGNVCVGRDVSVDELRRMYHAVGVASGGLIRVLHGCTLLLPDVLRLKYFKLHSRNGGAAPLVHVLVTHGRGDMLCLHVRCLAMNTLGKAACMGQVLSVLCRQVGPKGAYVKVCVPRYSLCAQIHRVLRCAALTCGPRLQGCCIPCMLLEELLPAGAPTRSVAAAAAKLPWPLLCCWCCCC